MEENSVIYYNDFEECNFDKKEELEKFIEGELKEFIEGELKEFIEEEQKKFNKEKTKNIIMHIGLSYKNYPFILIIDSDGNTLFYVFNGVSYYYPDLVIQQIEEQIKKDEGICI